MIRGRKDGGPEGLDDLAVYSTTNIMSWLQFCLGMYKGNLLTYHHHYVFSFKVKITATTMSITNIIPIRAPTVPPAILPALTAVV